MARQRYHISLLMLKKYFTHSRNIFNTQRDIKYIRAATKHHLCVLILKLFPPIINKNDCLSKSLSTLLHTKPFWHRDVQIINQDTFCHIP